MKRPNILILMPDQFRYDCIGSCGNFPVSTPNIDRIASEGLRFSQATTVCPICMPARASFANGQYPHNHGMWTNNGEMLAEHETFFQILQKAGYYTAHIGKSHYYEHKHSMHMRERETYMKARGFSYVHETTGPWATCHTASYMTDEWDKKGLWEKFKEDYKERKDPGLVRPSPLDVEDFLDSYIGRKAVEFVSSYSEDNPFCLFVGFGGPHEPWDAPGSYASMYSPSRMPKPIPGSKPAENIPDWLKSKRDFKELPEKILSKAPEMAANYLGKISLVDHWIGKILDTCSGKGLLDDLMIVFWSDHGEMLGDHGMLHKAVFYESSVRVPLIVRWPGKIPEGKTSEALAEIIDVFPTLLEAAGCEMSHRCLGRSLWPVISDPSCEIRDNQLGEIYHGGRNIMIRSRKHKYVVDEQARGYMLYDLEADPKEQNNLAAQGTGIENELREQLLKSIVKMQYHMC